MSEKTNLYVLSVIVGAVVGVEESGCSSTLVFDDDDDDDDDLGGEKGEQDKGNDSERQEL